DCLCPSACSRNGATTASGGSPSASPLRCDSLNGLKPNGAMGGLLYNRAPYTAAIEPLACSEDTVWLGEYLSVLRRRKWSILIVTLLAVLGALLYGRQQTPIYESNARVNATVVLQTQNAPQAPEMATEASFVTSDDVTKCAYL